MRSRCAVSSLSCSERLRFRRRPSPTARGADLEPTTGNVAEVREALLCLHNEERAERSLPALKENTRLRRRGRRRTPRTWSARLLQPHRARRSDVRGADPRRRVRAAGTTAGQLGENLAWGTGALATPRGVMAAWMDSPGHRHTILQPRLP